MFLIEVPLYTLLPNTIIQKYLVYVTHNGALIDMLICTVDTYNVAVTYRLYRRQ